MNKLGPAEHDLIGNWVVTEHGVRGDDITERIEWLTKDVLKKVAYSPEYGAWETIFRESCRWPPMGTYLPKRRYAWRGTPASYKHFGRASYGKIRSDGSSSFSLNKLIATERSQV